jgi:hypothetical protein
MKNTIFLDVMPCILVEIHQRSTCSLLLADYLHDLLFDSEDRCCVFLRNVNEILPNFTVSRARRQHYFYLQSYIIALQYHLRIGFSRYGFCTVYIVMYSVRCLRD